MNFIMPRVVYIERLKAMILICNRHIIKMDYDTKHEIRDYSTINEHFITLLSLIGYQKYWLIKNYLHTIANRRIGVGENYSMAVGNGTIEIYESIRTEGNCKEN